MVKILFFSTSRSDYSIILPIFQKSRLSKNNISRLVITGEHQDVKGLNLEEDSDIIVLNDYKNDSNSEINTIRTVSKMIIRVSDLIDIELPDWIVITGDRYESLAVVYSTFLRRIRIAHIHGGELTIGAYDDSIRHSISKLSHIHFVSHDRYKERLISMGENPSTVFVVGAPALENLSQAKPLSIESIVKDFGYSFGKKNILITIHPVTNNVTETIEMIESVKLLIYEHSEFAFFISSVNSDPDNELVSNFLNELASENRLINFLPYNNPLLYQSLLYYSDIMVGNSSSGIIEASLFDTVTINIGTRQKGRISSNSVIHCHADYNSLKEAFLEGLIIKNRESFNFHNPFYLKGGINKLVSILDSNNIGFLKEFYDSKL